MIQHAVMHAHIDNSASSARHTTSQPTTRQQRNLKMRGLTHLEVEKFTPEQLPVERHRGLRVLPFGLFVHRIQSDVHSACGEAAKLEVRGQHGG